MQVLHVSRGRAIDLRRARAALAGLRNSSAPPNRAPGAFEYGGARPARPSPGQSGRGTWPVDHLGDLLGTPRRLLPPSLLRYFSYASSRPQQVVSSRRAIPAPLIGEASLCFPGARPRYFSSPMLHRGQNDQPGCSSAAFSLQARGKSDLTFSSSKGSRNQVTIEEVNRPVMDNLHRT